MSGHVVGGRYRLQQQLGRGGTASVWRARDTRLDRNAAVKLLHPVRRADPVALERLRREAHSVARLEHRNIVGVYDFDVIDDAAYLVMELVEGRSVGELLALRGPMPVELAVSIAAQICDALGAAHAAGIVHRDIKPSNILIGPAGVVKVCDFGLVRLQQAAGETALTGAGAVVGSCHYMAPEQAVGQWVDGRCDLYALGCVLYMMLVGTPPFNGATAIDILDLHLDEPPVPLRAHRDDVPPELQQLVAELLAKERDDRPATARSVRDRLTAIGGLPAEIPGDPNQPTAEFSDVEAWQTRPTASIPPATAASDDLSTTGRHRTVAPGIAWYRRRVSGWVTALVAVALITTVLAAIALTGGEDRGTPVALPSLSVAAPPDPEEAAAEPASSPEPIRSTASPSSPPPAAAAATTTGAPARPGPADQIIGLAAIVQQQAAAGRLQPKAARTLLRDLNDVVRRLNAGETARAAERFTEFSNRVTELRADGAFTGTLPDLGPIAESLGRPGS